MKSHVLVFLPFALAACTSSNNGGASDASTVDGGNGIVQGPADTHCGTRSQPTDTASCHPDAGPPADAGATDGGTSSEYGTTMFNSEGDDDDCKYHVRWSATGVSTGTDVTFTVVVTTKSDGAAARGAPLRAEVFLNDTHPGPNTNQTSTETSTPGTYTVGPIRFDASGKWTVRFHFHEECEDTLVTSPHGHAAFFVQVP